MNILLKMLRFLVCFILPVKYAKKFDDRLMRSRELFNYNNELKVFFYVVFFPINILIDLIVIFIRLSFIWILPLGVYDSLCYLIKQFYFDICRDKLSIKTSLKRAKLFLELIICGREKKVSFGDKHPDKVFYVIRPYYFMEENELIPNLSNLLFHYYRNLQHLAYAVEHNYIPVVDWENYGPFAHGEQFKVNGTNNCWEYFWEQPSGYKLEEVYKSQNVILSIRNTRDIPQLPSCFFSDDLQKQAEDYAKRCPKYDKHIRLNSATSDYIYAKQSEFFPTNSRILGVSVRGTTYGDTSNYDNVGGHPVQPELRRLIDEVRILFREWEMDYIFITCELESVIKTFEIAFKDKVISLPRLRYKVAPQRGDVEKGLDELYVPGQRYQTNLDYLTEMVLLSRCTSLIAGMSGGVRAAIIWNNQKYENMKIFNNGLI